MLLSIRESQKSHAFPDTESAFKVRSVNARLGENCVSLLLQLSVPTFTPRRVEWIGIWVRLLRCCILLEKARLLNVLSTWKAQGLDEIRSRTVRKGNPRGKHPLFSLSNCLLLIKKFGSCMISKQRIMILWCGLMFHPPAGCLMGSGNWYSFHGEFLLLVGCSYYNKMACHSFQSR